MSDSERPQFNSAWFLKLGVELVLMSLAVFLGLMKAYRWSPAGDQSRARATPPLQ